MVIASEKARKHGYTQALIAVSDEVTTQFIFLAIGCRKICCPSRYARA
jgi:hypothetical protein